MTEQERQALDSAVKHLNATLAGIGEANRGRVAIRPYVDFNTEEGFAQVVVEVTTGVERFQ